MAKCATATQFARLRPPAIGRFRPSEGVHAFLPLFPLVVRYAAIASMKAVPSYFLPTMFEVTVALAAIAINSCATAAILLHHLTIFALKR